MGLVLLSAGCSSTNRFLLAKGSCEGGRLETVVVDGQLAITFDDAGGTIDLAGDRVSGRLRSGHEVRYPFSRVSRVRLRVPPDARETTTVDLDALREGPDWRPDGVIRRVVLRTGEVIALDDLSASFDGRARVVRFQPAPDLPTTLKEQIAAARDSARVPREIPFERILYLELRDGHPGRTALCVSGCVVVFLGGLVAASTSWEASMAGM